MREILFRGKVVNTNDDELIGKWIFGQLVVRRDHDEGNEKTFICESGYKFIRCLNKMIRTYEVDPETVGQYTGLTDKNGKRIFEGDIVMFLDYTEPAFVMWDQEDARWYMHYSDCMLDFSYRCVSSAIEVIGNIHDNPELIAEVEG